MKLRWRVEADHLVGIRPLRRHAVGSGDWHRAYQPRMFGARGSAAIIVAAVVSPLRMAWSTPSGEVPTTWVIA